jgi:SAM-dependent methyltransferase
MLIQDSKSRFSNRVDNYSRYRPGYPHGVIGLLRKACELTAESVVADVGSGTGILSRLFLENGNKVYGIEPNASMREAGERLLTAYSRFRSVSASAEATTLPRASVDFVVAGQAFHWFEPDAARAEFLRVLRPGGWVVVIWNERRTASTSFLSDYEKLLRTYSTEYSTVAATYPKAATLAGFYRGEYRGESFDNEQVVDFDGLRGRLLSSSYTPADGHPNYKPMLDELRAIYDSHEIDGRVLFEYDTRVYYGHLYPAAATAWE